MPLSPYDTSALSHMVSAVQRVLPAAEINPDDLAATLDTLFSDLGWRDGDSWSADFAEAAAAHPLAGTESERRAHHRKLASRYEAVAAAPDPRAPDLIDDEMRRALNRAARQRSRILRRFAHDTLQSGKRSADPPLLDRLADDMALLRKAASELAHYHRSRGSQQGPGHKSRIDMALERLAWLFMDLAGLDGDLRDLDREARPPFLQFAESALSPYTVFRSNTSGEAPKKRWVRFLDKHFSGEDQ